MRNTFCKNKGIKTYFIITVDTETYNVGGEVSSLDSHVYGNIKEELYGVDKIVELCEAYNVKATFFVDFCMSHQYGEQAVKKLCQKIDSKGHDVQVHAHPNWIKGHEKTTMHSYPFKTQDHVVKEARKLFIKCLGREPLAFRAGAYGANKDTIRALAKNNFKIDSSYFQFNKDCVLSAELSNCYANKIFFIDDIIELPVTVYSMNYGLSKKNSKIDINACSFAEIKYIVQHYIQEPKISLVILFLHSFSFIKQGKKTEDISPNFKAINKFDKTLELLVNDPQATIIDINSFYNQYSEELHKDNSEEDYIGSIGPRLIATRFWDRIG